jgi:hypothetical protein
MLAEVAGWQRHGHVGGVGCAGARGAADSLRKYMQGSLEVFLRSHPVACLAPSRAALSLRVSLYCGRMEQVGAMCHWVAPWYARAAAVLALLGLSSGAFGEGGLSGGWQKRHLPPRSAACGRTAGGVAGGVPVCWDRGLVRPQWEAGVLSAPCLPCCLAAGWARVYVGSRGQPRWFDPELAPHLAVAPRCLIPC